MSKAEMIRAHTREKYVSPARRRKQKSFSIRVGDIVRELKLTGRAPAVCSALKTRQFLQSNELRLVDQSGPASGQSTTVTYTYEFVDPKQSASPAEDPWKKMRGALKRVFADMGGGEAYLRGERSGFYANDEEGK